MNPVAELDRRFSDAHARPPDWADVRARLVETDLYWMTTVRADGRPHMTPLLAVWADDALHFCTGPDEQKARNLGRNANCILTAGSDDLHSGLDVVVEGQAARLHDDATLRRLAGAWAEKYGEDWRFRVEDGAFAHGDEGRALVFAVVPVKVLAFTKGTYGQTRWRFDRRA